MSETKRKGHKNYAKTKTKTARDIKKFIDSRQVKKRKREPEGSA
jgi:hypothetical protein